MVTQAHCIRQWQLLNKHWQSSISLYKRQAEAWNTRKPIHNTAVDPWMPLEVKMTDRKLAV